MKRLLKNLSVCAFVCAIASFNPAWGQGARATLGGRVTDVQGAVVPERRCRGHFGRNRGPANHQNQRAGQLDRSVSDARPLRLHGVLIRLPGIRAQGHPPANRRQQVDRHCNWNWAPTTQVTVTAEAPLIDTTAATSGTVITQEQINEMPSMSRVSTILATLSPGVLQQDQNQNVAHMWSHDAASQITVDGGRNNTRSNTFELDGMPNLKTGGQVAFIPAPEAIQEFRVVMNAYDASIGRQAGGTIQMTLKSGTNKSARQPVRVQPEQHPERQSLPDQPDRRRQASGALQRVRRHDRRTGVDSRRSTTARRRPSSSSTTTASATPTRASTSARCPPTSSAKAISASPTPRSCRTACDRSSRSRSSIR